MSRLSDALSSKIRIIRVSPDTKELVSELKSIAESQKRIAAALEIVVAASYSVVPSQYADVMKAYTPTEPAADPENEPALLRRARLDPEWAEERAAALEILREAGHHIPAEAWRTIGMNPPAGSDENPVSESAESAESPESKAD